MSKQKNFFVVGAFSCAAILFGVAGCGNTEADGAAGSGGAQATQDVQSNPNLPPQAKAAAAASAAQGKAQGEAAARAAGQTAPK